MRAEMDQPVFGEIKRMGEESAVSVNERPQEETITTEAKETSPAGEAIYDEVIICTNCGKSMPPDSVLCMSCGYNIRSGKTHDQAVLSSTTPGMPARSYVPQSANSQKNGGIGRSAYLLCMLAVAFGVYYFSTVYDFSEAMGSIARNEPIEIGIVLMFFALFGLNMFIASFRLKNVGTTRNWLWVFALSLIPKVNILAWICQIWVFYRLICCPAGYEEHKKLDAIGKVFLFCSFVR